MHKNKISDENKKDICGEELKKLNLFTKKYLDYIKNIKANEIAHYLML